MGHHRPCRGNCELNTREPSATEGRQSRLLLTRVISLVEDSTNSLTVPATVKHNGVTVETQQLRYRRAQETLQWDAAGNLTNDAVLAFTYDAEDRLIEIKDKTAPTTRTELRYDYLGRRVEEKDYTVGTLSRQRRFVWAGWELIGEVDVNVGTGAKRMQRTFTWGPDLSGRIHGVGGIGGLLLVDHSSTQQTVAGGDGRGNVTVLLDALETDTTTPMNNLKAGVEYAPYGEMVRTVGDLGQMPFRFQSKWALGQGWTGSWPLELLDFGRRMYAPGLGRFISRDPVGESAGANLYHYCGNDPVNRIDPLGLWPLGGPVRVARDPWYFDANGHIWFEGEWSQPSAGAFYGPSAEGRHSGGAASSGHFEWVAPPEVSGGESPFVEVGRDGNRIIIAPIVVTGSRGYWIWVPGSNGSIRILTGGNRGTSGRGGRVSLSLGDGDSSSAAQSSANGRSWYVTPRSFGGWAADQVYDLLASGAGLVGETLGVGLNMLGQAFLGDPNLGSDFTQTASNLYASRSPAARAGWYDAGHPVTVVATLGVGVLVPERGAIVVTERGVTLVYQSLNGAGDVIYVGITGNFERRAAEQIVQRSILIQPIPGLQNLSRTDARAVEQVLIESYGLGRNGGTLLNRINSISLRNAIYEQSIQRGTELLRQAGYRGF